MIPVERFLQCVQENADRIHGYELGHDGSDGKSDCIGLIIGALELAGFRWPGTHGSNWAARYAMQEPGVLYISDALYLEQSDQEDSLTRQELQTYGADPFHQHLLKGD